MAGNEKQEQLVFIDGKKKALYALFSAENFGYLAIGADDNDVDGIGFQNPEDDTMSNGFLEVLGDTSYLRIPLTPLDDTEDLNTGKVTVRFQADLDVDNIINGIDINQFAIVDNSEASHGNTSFFAASVFPDIPKNENIAISFIIEMKL